MALKPAGKAMIIGVVVAAIAGGVIMSGALDKLGSSKQQPINGDGEVVKTAPLPQLAEPSRPEPAAAPAPVVQAPAAAPSPATKDAFDALIHEAGKK